MSQLMKITKNTAIRLHDKTFIGIPQQMIEAWQKAYGNSDAVITLAQIQNVIRVTELTRDIDPMWFIPETLRGSVSNQNFLASELGKFIQIAMLIGREIKPKYFFTGTNARWDEESLLLVKGIQECRWEAGALWLNLQVVYRKDVFYVMKEVGDLIALLYGSS
ncbi:hypothetical protein N7513_001925 [Penicillium frequentans]|nr:hypothetical protein N7513_001925 [Penicillium glabrum]